MLKRLIADTCKPALNSIVDLVPFCLFFFTTVASNLVPRFIFRQKVIDLLDGHLIFFFFGFFLLRHYISPWPLILSSFLSFNPQAEFCSTLSNKEKQNSSRIKPKIPKSVNDHVKKQVSRVYNLMASPSNLIGKD